MSAVFGFVHLDRQPAGEEDLARMALALAHLELGAPSLYTVGAVAFGARLLSITEEDDYERQPLQVGSQLLVASVRLDNRAELRRELEVQNSADWPDSRFVLEAYKKWGIGCCDRLLGDWCFALWDNATQKLVLARDATGNSGLYWSFFGKTVVFSNALRAVVAHPGVPGQLDELMAACFLTRFDDPETEDATFYAKVKSVLPGTCVSFGSGGMAISRWWNPDAMGELRLNDPAQYFEAFRSVYTEAVRCRLRAKSGACIAAAVSSGLDSTSVVALAAPLLREMGVPLRAYVHRPLDGVGSFGLGTLTDEFELASDFALHVGNVAVTGLRHENSSWLAGVARSLLTHGQPTGSVIPHYWVSDLLQRAKGEGVGVLLTGQGGNGTVSWSGTGNLWPDIRTGRISSAANALLQSRMPLRRAVRVQLLSPLRQEFRRLKLRSARNLPVNWADHSSINPDFAKALKLTERMHTRRWDIENRPPFSAEQLRSWRLEGSFGGGLGRGWQEMGNAAGVSVRDPTRDRRLVELCWRMPDAIFWGRGATRALVREGLATDLPGSIRNSQVKGVQCADLALRFKREHVAVAELVAQCSDLSTSQSWINARLLQKNLSQLKNLTDYSAYRLIFKKIGPAVGILKFLQMVGRC